jgi:hypothetical protein
MAQSLEQIVAQFTLPGGGQPMTRAAGGVTARANAEVQRVASPAPAAVSPAPNGRHREAQRVD